MRAELKIFTFKEGMLARMAHDLRLSLPDWEATLVDGRIDATFRVASIAIDGVAHGPSVELDTLSASDRRKILSAVDTEILHIKQFPTVRYEGPVHVGADGILVDGKLTLRGVTRECRCKLQAHGPAWTTEVTVVPSQFGIPPFKALAGAIRLQDRVVVRVSLWLEEQTPTGLAAKLEPTRFAP